MRVSVSEPERLSIAASRAAEMAGTIHDDSVARSQGYQSAFVPGETVGHLGFREALRKFGPGWLDSGWYSFRLLAPVYLTSDVQVRLSGAPSGALEVAVLDVAGPTCLLGEAGRGACRDGDPWDSNSIGTLEPDRVFPGLAIGERIAEVAVQVRGLDVIEPFLEPANDSHPLFRSTGGVVPPEYLMLVALRSVHSDLIEQASHCVPEPNAGMWAEHAAIWHAPLRLDTEYQLVSTLVDKGQRRRAAFATTQTSVLDPTGSTVATLRQSSKWLRGPAAEAAHGATR